MGNIRNGARTVLNILAQACRLSRLPGFRAGINGILGANGAGFFAVWDPMCAFVETLIGLDNWYNQIDTTTQTGGGEDQSFGLA